MVQSALVQFVEFIYIYKLTQVVTQVMDRLSTTKKKKATTTKKSTKKKKYKLPVKK